MILKQKKKKKLEYSLCSRHCTALDRFALVTSFANVINHLFFLIVIFGNAEEWYWLYNHICLFITSRQFLHTLSLFLLLSLSLSRSLFLSLNIKFSPYTHFIFMLKPSLMKMTFIISLFSRILMVLNDSILSVHQEKGTLCFTIYTQGMGNF